jgi:CIC family chloride channel protein
MELVKYLRNEFIIRAIRWRPNESLVLITLGILVGLTCGIGVWLYKELIIVFHNISYNGLGSVMQPLGKWTLVLLPILGGVLVGLIAHFFIGEERHHGVSGIIEAVALAGGRLRYWRVPAKAVVSALSIGVGASVGPEDPSVQIGANLGSMFGQWLHFSDQRMRTLTAAGAAAGISAAFNAPIAGVFFALEIVLGEISGGALGIVLVAAVVSAVFTQAVTGAEPAFHVPPYGIQNLWKLPLYPVLGFISGLVAALYVWLIYKIQDLFHNWQIPQWVKPAIAGVGIGVVGLWVPQMLGVGYDTIDLILNGQELVFSLLIVFLIAKLVMTPVSLGAGFLGGVFAPSLYLGCALGGAFGVLAADLFPSLGIHPQAFAMIGMAAVLAGAVHSPLTAIILLFEMTNDYMVILPVMLAVAIALLTSQLLQHDSVYMIGLVRKGIRLQRGRDVEVLESITVEEIMQTDIMTFHESDSLVQASEVFMRTRHHGLPVVNEAGELVGVLTVQDLDQARMDGGDKHTVGEVCTRDLIVAYPDESIGSVLQQMSSHDVGRLPVVARNNPKQLLGLLRRADVIRAYDMALTRRAALKHHVHQVRLGALRGDDVNVIELEVSPNSSSVGVPMKSISWPQECLVASIRRGHKLIVPHGNTILQANDKLVAVADAKGREFLYQTFTDQNTDHNQT